jgi:hypothetical protein
MMNAGDIDHRILPGLQKMQKAGQVRRFTMPAIQQDFSSNDNLANPIAVRKRMEADFITKRNIDKRNALQAAQDRQGYIRQAEAPRSAASKAWAIMTNPMTALKYKVQGRDIPDNFERGEKNSLDLAANIVNPFFYINEGKEFLKGVGNIGYKAVTDPFSLSGMDFLNTAMHGVGALPAVGEAVQGTNLVSKGLRGATKAYKGTAGMTSKLGRVKNAANAGAIELGYTPGDITGHSYFNIPADEVSKMMSQEMGSLPKGAFTFDGNMSKNSAPLFWTQAARSPKGFTVVNPGTTQGLNWSGTMGKRVSNALPKNIEKIMPDAANYAEELKNRIDYLKKLGDPKSLQNAAQLERDGISSQIVSDLPNAAVADYNVKNSFTDFLNNYKTTLDNPIIEVNRKTGLNFPMTKILDENIGKWTNDFYEQPSIYMVKGNPLSRVPKLIGDYTKTRANNFYFGDKYANPRMPFIKANTLYNTPKYIGNQSDYEMGGSYDQPCYECGGAVKRYDVGGYYDCPDQEKDPVTGKCAADVARGKEANAANKAASKDMNAWAKQVASMDKEIAKQNAAQTAGQLTFDYDWMGSPVDKSEKKAAMGQYKQFFQQNPNTFIADDTSGYSPEQKYIIASKLKQRMSTPMGAKLVQQQFGVDPRFYDLQRLQTEMAPKMGGWNGMRNWLFNVYKEEGGPIVDPRGQWAHPGKVTRIPSSNITMEGVPYPVLGVASSGQQVMMQPGQNYNFGDAEYVDEYPMMQFGGGTLLGPSPMIMSLASKVANYFSKPNSSATNNGSTSDTRKSAKELFGISPYDEMHSTFYDKNENFYDKLEANDTKNYGKSPNYINLSSGRFRGAKVAPGMINDIVNAAKANNVDPWVMLSLVGRESTFGSGTAQNKDRADNKQGLVSGWNVAEDYKPYEVDRYLADKQVPGIKVVKDSHGWNYKVEDEKAIENYLKSNPQLITDYYKKLESTPDLGKLDSFSLAAQRIKKKGIQNYNPGDPRYSSMVNSDMNLLKNDAALKAYMKTLGYREGGEFGEGLLSKTVSCSNCGWSWKAVDGGSDPLSCHKCGGTVKMQAGGQPDYNSILDQNAADAEKYPSAYHKDFVTGYPVANSAGSIPRPGGFDCPPGYTKYRNPDGTFSCIMTNSAPGSSKVDFSRMTKVADDMQFSRPMRPPLASIPIRKNGGLINMQGGGGQSTIDSVRHQANKILQYEQLRGGPGGAPLPQYSNPKYMDMLMGKVYPEVRKIMPNASAMEAGEAMDFVFNAGFDQGTNKITKDPRAFALQEYYRQNDPSKLDADGKWAGRKNAPYSFDQEYNNTIGKLPENQRRILMNKGRDWYYKNINNPAPGVPNSNYNDTWYGRIWNTNDYQPFNPNNPNFTPKKEQGGEASLWDLIKMAQGGEMIRRADGSYSRRGLWDNMRANKGSGKKPTKQMLEQERKIKSKNK